ncbi:hypothetical protein V8C44DRAFT_330446 [Trichoderma aethiopicum]
MAPAAAAHLACFYLAQFTSLRKSPPEFYRHMKGRARNAEEYGKDNSPDASCLIFDTHFFASPRNVQELSPLLHAPDQGMPSDITWNIHTFVRRRVEAGAKSPRAGTPDLSSCLAP